MNTGHVRLFCILDYFLLKKQKPLKWNVSKSESIRLFKVLDTHAKLDFRRNLGEGPFCMCLAKVRYQFVNVPKFPDEKHHSVVV